MKVLSGQILIDEVRSRCERLASRLWIASPFIGDWKAVRKILGRKWVDDENIEVRLITDDTNIDRTAHKTVGHFQRRGDVMNLRGLHAKIYIVDADVIVTSANLTGAAFFKRFEAGVLISGSGATAAVKLYSNWWEHMARRFPADFVPSVSSKRAKAVKEETSGPSLPKLWHEPPDPGDPYGGLVTEFRDYPLFLRCYRDFAGAYSRIQRVWPGSPLYFETDAFLNYLFHEAPGRPSEKHRKINPRRLDSNSRVNEIRKYASMFSSWLSSGEAADVDSPEWRPGRTKVIRNKLSRARIMRITRNDVKCVVDCLNCMNSHPLNRYMFLNPKNNRLQSIRNAWNSLLHGDGPLETRMSDCHRALNRFGRSSIQELIGFFYPEQYPLRNSNSNAGLRFFGYDVPVY